MKSSVQSVFAVVLGFMIIGVLVSITDFALSQIWPDAFWNPGNFADMDEARANFKMPAMPFLITNYAYGFIYAIIGGWLAARLSPSLPMRHVAALGLIILVMGIITMNMFELPVPLWHNAILIILGISGVHIGGKVFMNRIDSTYEG